MSNFKNSLISNKNLAPQSIFPSQAISDKMIDDVHLSTKADYHFALGESLSLEGNSKRAIEEFKSTLIYDPNSPQVMTRLAAEYLRNGLVNESLEHAQAAVKINPNYTEARVLLGGIYTSLKMYGDAKKQYTSLIQQDAKNYEAYIYLGALLAEQGLFDDAKVTFKKLIAVGDDEFRYMAHYYMARIHLEEGGSKNTNLAIKQLNKSLSIKPSYKEATVQLANIYEQKQNLDKALEIYITYEDRYGPFEQSAQFLSQYYLETNQLDKAAEQLQYMESFSPGNLNTKTKVALILVERKQYETAITKLLEILKIDPTLDKIRFYLGAVYEEVSLPEEALSQYNEIKLTSDYFADAIMHMALIHKNNENLGAAISVAEKGLRKRKDVPEIYTLHATLLNEARDYEKALAVTTEAVKVFPQDNDIRYMHATILDKNGKVGEMITELERIISLDENHVQALNYLAYTHADRGTNLDKALVMAERANKIKPRDAYILDTIGWIYFKMGNTSKAIQTLEVAHRIKPNESIVAEHLGDAYFKYQMSSKARIMYQKALTMELNGGQEDRIKTKLVSIEQQYIKKANPNRLPASN